MAIRIDNSGSLLTNLKNAPKIPSGASGEATQSSKTIGETPPKLVPLSYLGSLAGLFGKGGTISKLKRRLNRLKKKNNRVAPAIGTIACVDDDDLVYLGVEFLQEYHDQEDILAGVMAHEWGHSCAVKPKKEELQKMNWNELFAMRRSHEVLADEISGRLLALMGYDPENFVEFLKKTTKGTHNLKYHDSQTRAQIVLNGYHDEKRKMSLAKDLFPGSVGYKNDYHSKLIDDDI